MNILHLVKVHFDKRRQGIDDAWIDARLEFYRQWTRRSLSAQTHKHFGVWASCGVNMTAGDAMRVMSGTHADFVSFGCDHAPDAAIRKEAERYDYVYVTRLDSDDLYAPDALRIAHEARPSVHGHVEATMFRRGYLHDVRTGETGVYHGPSTPFHTMMIPADVFSSQEKYAALDYGDHSQVNGRFRTTVLPDWKFAVLVHGGNFISDMQYGREKLFGVEERWTVDRFLRQPVVFDVDDFCDRWNCLPELDAIKERYPKFKCTLFTIPRGTDLETLQDATKRDWVQLAVHGLTHEPNEELKVTTPNDLWSKVPSRSLNSGFYVRGFRPPGWYITAEHVKALNQLGMWVALHERDERTLGPLCEHGYYVVRGSGSHWHTSGEGQRAHSVCKNGIRECLPEILERWPRDQEFAFVSDSILKIK